LALLEFNFPRIGAVSDAEIEAIAVGVAEGTVALSEVAQWLEGIYLCSNPTAFECDPSDIGS
jgi:hypothetical protein